MATQKAKGRIIIAGPGAGKTHNMVANIIHALPKLSPCRYMAVITYTNAATSNIQKRIAQKITIPENLFIGTIHAFLNRFIVLPFASMGSTDIGNEKLFMQCGTEDVFKKFEKRKPKAERSKTVQEAAAILSRITKRLNQLGYITFDQTLVISKKCMDNNNICRIISNRLQFLFVDEFQDSCNQVFAIIENIRKQNKTKIYCVGDPEQYIQSFDSSIRSFNKIPILKAATSSSYIVEINTVNFRSGKKIVAFLNHFNGRNFNSIKFQQDAHSKNSMSPPDGEDVCFITKTSNVKEILDDFYGRCEMASIPMGGRCILSKKNELFNRITSAVNNKYMNPKRANNILPLKAIQDTLLTTLQMNKSQFLERYQTGIYTLRKHAIAIFKAINNGTITNEDTYGNFITSALQLQMKEGLPVKIENLKADNIRREVSSVVSVSNIHTIKGLESEAVLALAKTEAELLLWLETDTATRDDKRDNETTDYPRLGYVAFSRAERLLCIACMERISKSTIAKMEYLNVKIV